MKRPARLWPEMDEIGTPAYEEEGALWLDQGASWELENEEEAEDIADDPASDAPIAVLWLPTPGGPCREYFIYRPEPAPLPEPPPPPEPPRRPFGFVKR